MDMTLAERTQAVVRYLAKKTKKTQFEIGQELGYTNKSSFSAVLNGKSPIPKMLPKRLAALDPSVNLDFLLGISDEILMPGYSRHTETTGGNQTPPQYQGTGVWLPTELVRMFTDMSATIRSQQETIRALLTPTENRTDKGGIAASL